MFVVVINLLVFPQACGGSFKISHWKNYKVIIFNFQIIWTLKLKISNTKIAFIIENNFAQLCWSLWHYIYIYIYNGVVYSVYYFDVAYFHTKKIIALEFQDNCKKMMKVIKITCLDTPIYASYNYAWFIIGMRRGEGGFKPYM